MLNHGPMGLLNLPVEIPVRIDGRYKLQEQIGSGAYGMMISEIILHTR